MKLNAFLGGIVAVACILLCSCHRAENTAKPKAQFRLTYNIFFPASHGAAKLGKAWAEEVERRTNGAVVVDVYPGSVLSTDSENFNGVVFGSTDVGMSCFSYSRGLFPLIEVLIYHGVIRTERPPRKLPTPSSIISSRRNWRMSN